jgi:hypothetical protein
MAAVAVHDRHPCQLQLASMARRIDMNAEQIAEGLRSTRLLQRPVLVLGERLEEVGELAAQHLVGRGAHGLGESRREEGDPELGIRLPDPVRGGVRHVAKAGLARLQGAMDTACEPQHPGCGHDDDQQGEAEHRRNPQEGGRARPIRGPHQLRQLRAVGGEDRQRGSPRRWRPGRHHA